VTVENCTYVLIIDVALDNGVTVDLDNPAMESPLGLGLQRVTRRAVAKRRRREAA